MSERGNIFDLKLLTASKEIGLRRLRSYCASLGGGAQMFIAFDDLLRHLEATQHDRRSSIIVHDCTVPLTAKQLDMLRHHARVFIVQTAGAAGDTLVPPAGAPSWSVESYLQCSLTTFLESPVVRTSMAHLCKGDQPFQVARLLRWGHAAQTWKAGGQVGVGDASFAFIKSLNLGGEGRRLTEMFTHFLEASLRPLQLHKESVMFGSDGVLMMVAARCRALPGMSVQQVAYELRVHDFPVAICNRADGDIFEIAGLHYPYQQLTVPGERIVMVFNELPGAAQVAVHTPPGEPHGATPYKSAETETGPNLAAALYKIDKAG